jgi:hypothetical protein
VNDDDDAASETERLGRQWRGLDGGWPGGFLRPGLASSLEPARLPVGNADAASATSGQKQQYREAKPSATISSART